MTAPGRYGLPGVVATTSGSTRCHSIVGCPVPERNDLVASAGSFRPFGRRRRSWSSLCTDSDAGGRWPDDELERISSDRGECPGSRWRASARRHAADGETGPRSVVDPRDDALPRLRAPGPTARHRSLHRLLRRAGTSAAMRARRRRTTASAAPRAARTAAGPRALASHGATCGVLGRDGGPGSHR
jgi:hypothetical protein